MAPGPSTAAGTRNVSVAGDVVGSVIVTGDNNNLNLLLGPEQGALIEQLARRLRPAARLRPAPVRSIPPRFTDTLDREDEVRTILGLVAARTPVNVRGPQGIGKTYVLLGALGKNDPVLADGAVYLYAPGPLDDVLQLIFEAWYECDPPHRPSNPQLRRHLAEITGVLVLDGAELTRDAGQQVLLAAAGCRVVVASRARALTEGTSLALRGLERADALTLVERELGRALTHAEMQPANQICNALDGHPLMIREAVASAVDAGRSLAGLADELSAGDATAALAQEKIEAAGAEEQRILAALALFGGAAVGQDHLRAIAGAEHLDEALVAALRCRDVRAHSPRYSLGAALAQRPPAAPVAIGDRALTHFTSWAMEHRDDVAALLEDGPALIALLRWAVDAGRFTEAIALGRAVDHAFALTRRFGAWGDVLNLVHAAALAHQDRHAEAWALHQLGTRAICLGDRAAAVAMLSQAIELRRAQGDSVGIRASESNLALATRPRGIWPWIVGHSVLVIATVLVIAAGVVAAATLRHGSSSSQSPTTATSPPAQTTHSGTTTHPATTTHSPPPAATRELTIAPPAGGTVTVADRHQICAPDCNVRVTSGTALTLRAVPQPGYSFAGWSGACSDANASCQVTMTADRNVTATFQPQLTVSSSGIGVKSAPPGISCPGTCTAAFPSGTQVTLSATMAAYWQGAAKCVPPPSSPSNGTTGGSSTGTTGGSTTGTTGGSTTGTTGGTTTGTTGGSTTGTTGTAKVRQPTQVVPRAGEPNCIVTVTGPLTVTVTPAR